MKKVILSLLLACPVLTMTAQRSITTGGGISDQMLQEIKQAQRQTATADRALRNALAGTAINTLATNPNNPATNDKYFSHSVPSKGITDQESSGRCWLFTGLNVLRARMIKEYNLGEIGRASCRERV